MYLEKPSTIKKVNDLKYYQLQLDNKIQKRSGKSRRETIDNRVRALYVEVIELFNEVAFFKDWSKKQEEPDLEKVRMEYIDCVHFMLSLAIDFDIKVIVNRYSTKKYTWEHLFDNSRYLISNYINQFVNCSSKKEKKIRLVYIFDELNKIGSTLGMSEKDIIKVYMEKNKINHDRQKNNY